MGKMRKVVATVASITADRTDGYCRWVDMDEDRRFLGHRPSNYFGDRWNQGSWRYKAHALEVTIRLRDKWGTTIELHRTVFQGSKYHPLSVRLAEKMAN